MDLERLPASQLGPAISGAPDIAALHVQLLLFLFRGLCAADGRIDHDRHPGIGALPVPSEADH
ncbi:hypothetical protein D3C81_2068100 [compost metagenome]